MIILGIESSCDETAVAIVQDGRQILSNVIVSQIDIFKAYGGVIPEVAARSHLEAILPVLHQAFRDASFTTKDGSDDWSKIDAIAVTHTPGLLGSLLIGTLTARTLAILHHKPLYAVHHLKSHIYSTWCNSGASGDFSQRQATAARAAQQPSAKGTVKNLPDAPTFPLLALVVSGGHTQIIHMPAHNQFHIIGTTRDDAVGECYDKVAKILGLPYPGGPSIARAATGHVTQNGHTTIIQPGNPHKYKLPHPKLTHTARPGNTAANPTYDFSFSGLKTAVLRAVQAELGKPISFPSHQLAPLLTPQQIADFAASFQQTAVDILVQNLRRATQRYNDLVQPIKSLVIAGGVSANQLLREEILKAFSEDSSPASPKMYIPDARQRMTFLGESRSEENALNCFFPAQNLTGDNAAMVASAAYFERQSGVHPTDPFTLTLAPRSTIH